MSKLIFGCGYLGERVARRWSDGDEVFVATRSAQRFPRFQGQGFRPVVADVTRPSSLRNLPSAEVVLFSVGHDRTSNQSIDEVYAGGVRNVLNALPSSVARFIYISTTGVYGPGASEWIDEQSPTDPQRDGGKASLAAERILASHPLGQRSVILRLAGIYGPDRVPFIDDIRNGRPLAAPTSGYLNLIHVEDAVDVVLAAAALPSFDDGPKVYCVSDGHPVERLDFYHEVARQLGAPAPTFVEPDPKSARAMRARSNRRVRNDRMLKELIVHLKYPDYRAGVAAVLETQAQ